MSTRRTGLEIGHDLTGMIIWRDGICYLISRTDVREPNTIDPTYGHLMPMDGRGPELAVPWEELDA